MKDKAKVTLGDVAKASGLSLATVSMILSGRADVSFAEETVRRVRNAAQELAYAPPAKKRRALFARKTVLIVCPNVSNPYYATLVQAVQQAAARKGCETLVHATYRDPEAESGILQSVPASDLAGVVFTMMPQCTDLVERVNRHVPMVVIGDRDTSLNVDTVEMNNHGAGTLVARYLIGLGHRHIAYVSTTLNTANSARLCRLRGVQETYERECPGGSILVRSREVTPQEERDCISIEHQVGFALAQRCLAEAPQLTAFVAVNDMVAYGVIDAVRGAGFGVPGDYSVCGFDNIFPSHFTPMALTTVEHHMQEKGHNAFDILYAKMTGEASDCNITRVEFTHHLVERETTAPPGKSRTALES